MAALVAVLDANILYPASLRDLLLRLAAAGLYQARWTDRILDETFDAVLRTRPDLDPARLERTRRLMTTHFPDARVVDYETLLPALTLPDADDRHVLAAAIRSHAEVIVTHNLKDFPRPALEPFEVDAMSPDTFVVDLLADRPYAIIEVLRVQASDATRPPMTLERLLERLAIVGLRRSVSEIRRLLER